MYYFVLYIRIFDTIDALIRFGLLYQLNFFTKNIAYHEDTIFSNEIPMYTIVRSS